MSREASYDEDMGEEEDDAPPTADANKGRRSTRQVRMAIT